MTTDTLKPAAALAATRNPVFPGESEEYAEAREQLLASEIEARRVLTRLAAQRKALPPGPLVDRDYRFRDADGRELGLIDLFGACDTLITYFWMYGPEREAPCPMCADTLAGMNGVARNVAQRAALKVIGRSPVPRQQEFARSRGWDDLEFVQTVDDEYARDTQALAANGDEYPSFIVYRREGDRVRVFYAAEMPAGAADLSPLWNILDHTPEGRGTDWHPKLDYEDAGCAAG